MESGFYSLNTTPHFKQNENSFVTFLPMGKNLYDFRTIYVPLIYGICRCCVSIANGLNIALF
jgi:hypothetical protein